MLIYRPVVIPTSFLEILGNCVCYFRSISGANQEGLVRRWPARVISERPFPPFTRPPCSITIALIILILGINNGVLLMKLESC